MPPIARVVASDPVDWKEVTASYAADASVQVPDVILSFPYGAPLEVTLSQSYAQ